MARLLLLIPTTSYRVKDFMNAAHKSSVNVTIGSDEESVLNTFQSSGILQLKFDDLNESIEKIKTFHKSYPINSIIGVEEQTCLLAVKALEQLGLPHNSIGSIKASINKYLFRNTLKKNGLPNPNFQCLKPNHDIRTRANSTDYPCVLKPVNRSASQGVIRANDPREFVAAYQRIASLVSGEDIIVEDFLPGQEVALEGLLTDGELKTLAIFDKPEPLDGPYFEETIYVTPSQHPIVIQDRLHQIVQQAANALGLTEGPVHAELRIRDQESTVNEQGPWLIELAARSIGGLCSRSLLFEGGRSLEELIISHALKEPIGCVNREKLASGVMMIPIPKAGILKSVEGEIDARALKHVKDLQISIKIGQKLTPLPEGKQYLGFIFAKAESPLEVQASLRAAHSRLRFKID